MDTFVENSGVAEQEKHVQVAEHQKKVHAPAESSETADTPLNDATEWNGQGDDPVEDITLSPTEAKADPLGLRAINSPLNEMKAGYDYAFRRRRATA